MPNYAQAAIHIRRKKEREAREKGLKAEMERRNKEGDFTIQVGERTMEKLSFSLIHCSTWSWLKSKS